MKRKILSWILLLSLAAAGFAGCTDEDTRQETESAGAEEPGSPGVSGETEKEVFSVNTDETVLSFGGETVTVSWKALEALSCPVQVGEAVPFGDGELVSFTAEAESLNLSGSVFLGLEEELFDFEDAAGEEGAAIRDMMEEALSLQDERTAAAEKTVSGLTFAFGEGFSLPEEGSSDGQYVFYAAAQTKEGVVFLHVDAAAAAEERETLSAAVSNWFEALQSGREG